MHINPDYEAEGYDVKCRVPDCGFHHENVTPTLAATFMLDHAMHAGHPPLGEPMFTMRVISGFLGLDEDQPILTPDDGWRRPPTLSRNRSTSERDVTSEGQAPGKQK